MHPFGELETKVMDGLWQRGEPATVREVLEQLRTSRPLAYTTVMTVLANLHRKGQLRREMVGRAWAYSPVRTRAEHAASLLQGVLAESGDHAEALMHFVADLAPDDVLRLRRAVDAARRPRSGTR